MIHLPTFGLGSETTFAEASASCRFAISRAKIATRVHFFAATASFSARSSASITGSALDTSWAEGVLSGRLRAPDRLFSRPDEPSGAAPQLVRVQALEPLCRLESCATCFRTRFW